MLILVLSILMAATLVSPLAHAQAANACSELFRRTGFETPLASPSVVPPVTPLTTKFATRSTLDETVVAFHGTSESALRQLLRTGFLPPGNVRRPTLPPELNYRPNIYVAEVGRYSQAGIPTYGGPKVDTLGVMSADRAFEEAAVYAGIASLLREGLPKRLGIPINWRSRDYYFEVEDKEPSVFSELKALYKIRRQDALRAFREIDRIHSSGRPAGVVLALDSALYRDFDLCRCGDDGLRVHLPPEGLALKYIKQIIPLSREAQMILESEQGFAQP